MIGCELVMSSPAQELLSLWYGKSTRILREDQALLASGYLVVSEAARHGRGGERIGQP
jgi:hypothetical protein